MASGWGSGLIEMAVKSRLHRARAMMRERLAASGYASAKGELLH